MSDAWRGGERRTHPRVALEGSLRGKIQSTIEAPLVDLSLSGALLEITSALPTGTRYALRLPAPEGELRLETEVVRSYVHGFDREAPGKPAVRYRAAIKFVELDEVQRRRLQELLDAGLVSSGHTLAETAS